LETGLQYHKHVKLNYIKKNPTLLCKEPQNDN